MGRLYADEDFPFGAVLILRQWGHDVLTVQEAGRSGLGDPQVLADAIADGRVVLTHNHRHFRRLHAKSSTHFGIISATRDDNDLPGLSKRIHEAIVAMPNLANQFVRIVRPQPTTRP